MATLWRQLQLGTVALKLKPPNVSRASAADWRPRVVWLASLAGCRPRPRGAFFYGRRHGVVAARDAYAPLAFGQLVLRATDKALGYSPLWTGLQPNSNGDG